ncbi:MAG: helix-turn-helix domain-containing protein [Galbibacter orientalis]|uniref:helix-turn-helix domain-containing protein n=1 Tax=Galbibacter orientalis TaxID=453852 RepID=UPI0030011188
MKENKHEFNNYRIAVPRSYEEVFTHFYYAENNLNKRITKTLLPSYQTILIFNFKEKPYFRTQQNTRIEVDKFLVIGPVKKAFDYTLPPNTEILIVNFKDDAFYRFFRYSAISEHLPIQPEAIVHGDCFHILWHQLRKMDDINARINHILKFSEPYLMKRNKIAKELANFENQSISSIKSVAKEYGQTPRNIQLQHKKHFGYSAKELIRYKRFLKATEFIQGVASNTSKIDWFEIVNQCGYYDQSQLIRDFKYYIHLTPTEYIKFQQDICNPIS